MSTPRLSSSLLVDAKDLTTEERRRVHAAKVQLAKGNDEANAIVEGYQILDVDS